MRAPFWLLACVVGCQASSLLAQGIVPGTGVAVPNIGDNFEAENWSFKPNLPKSSHEQDEQIRYPSGRSSNQRWAEGLLRGCPDLVQRVATPEGGLPGSKGAMMIASRHSGIPGRLAGKSMQDDLIMIAKSPWGSAYPVSLSPSGVTRIYLPPFEEWENRSGSMFAFRAEVIGTRRVGKVEGWGIFAHEVDPEPEQSWPGIFIQYDVSKRNPEKRNRAYFVIRGGANGDIEGPEIEQAGWWTLGMSFTADGKVHYYARPGVENLDAGDHICSYFPYNYRVQRVNTLFFDTFNMEDGRTWSTRVVVDDTWLYVAKSSANVASRAKSRK